MSRLFPVMEQEFLPRISGTQVDLLEKGFPNKKQRKDDHNKKNSQPQQTMIREAWVVCVQYQAIHYA